MQNTEIVQALWRYGISSHVRVKSAGSSALKKGGLKGPLELPFSCNSLDLLVLFEAFFVIKEVLETTSNFGCKACFAQQKSSLAFASCLVMYGRG